MPACINCKYHVFPFPENDDWHECVHPQARHPVTGDQFLCERVRTDPIWGVCGREGVLFELKEAQASITLSDDERT